MLPSKHSADLPLRGIRHWLYYRRLIRHNRKVLDELMERCEAYLKAMRPALVLLDPII